MANIAIVQRYAYDSNRNGDFSYIDEMVNYLSQSHSVSVFTANMMLGRTLPFFRSGFKKATHRHARFAISLFGHTVSYAPTAWLTACTSIAGKLLRLNLPRLKSGITSEQRWILNKIKNAGFDKVLLVFDGVGFADYLSDNHIVYGAIPVLLYNNSSHLIEGRTTKIEHLIAREVANLSRAQMVGFHSDDDITAARTAGILNAVKIGVGVAVNKAMLGPRAPDQNTILFVAALADQNIRSLQWFLTTVFPRIIEDIPDIKLRVVGRIGQTIDNSALDNHIEKIGFVDNLSDEYGRAAVVIAPLILGSKGIKVKVAEALAHACPIVATSISIDSGDRMWAEEAILLADTPDDFFVAIVRVLRSTAEQRRLSVGAARIYESHIQPSAAYKDLDRYLSLTD